MYQLYRKLGIERSAFCKSFVRVRDRVIVIVGDVLNGEGRKALYSSSRKYKPGTAFLMQAHIILVMSQWNLVHILQPRVCTISTYCLR